jgi:membrane complex biogenesis BtpA family protein
MSFHELFDVRKPVIGCLHLLALPGAPLYGGSMRAVYDHALSEATALTEHAVDALIIENFRDKPFYPGRAPVETVVALAAVAREIKRQHACPLGINLLRNDGEAALAIATAIEASFIRVNVHAGAVVSDQGVIQGAGHLTMRLRAALRSNVLVFADVGVKHAAPLADRGLTAETVDTVERGLADAVIVSGEATGAETSLDDVRSVRAATDAPVLIGSGATPENIGEVFNLVDGFIVGSYFKKAGKADQLVEPTRVSTFMNAIKTLRAGLAWRLSDTSG